MSKKYDFAGWATAFNICCSDGRTIKRGAFKEQNGKTVPLVWSHDHTNPDNVLGHALLEDREDGMYAYGTFNDNPRAQNAKELVKHGDIKSLSIYANRLKQNGKDVIHGTIREVSLVLAGANPGARIETVVAHSDTSEEDAIIYCKDQDFILHSEGDANMEDPNNKQISEENANNQTDLEHSEGDGKDKKKDKTVKEVYDSLSEEQKTVVHAMIGEAVEDAINQTKKEMEDKKDMKHNAFDNNNETNENVISHSDFVKGVNDLLADAKKNGKSLRDEFEHSEISTKEIETKEDALMHGINDIENIFPEAHNVTPTPNVVDMKHDWVNAVMKGVKVVPFARIKSTYADLTADEARAKGYIKGKQKLEEFFSVMKRTTDPTTVYKLQKMDRDDVIDITDFDVIVFIKNEMRTKLQEELARAILVGDGRQASAEDKINESHIRPIAKDDDVYTIKAKTYPADTTKDQDAAQFIDDVVEAMDQYKGSGNVVCLLRRDMFTKLRLLKDSIGHRLYKNAEEIASAMDMNKIVPVPNIVFDTDNIYAVIVDLGDYNIGRNAKGNTSFFDDFDLNFNKMEYLIETRCSGALVKPYSALVFKTEPKQEKAAKVAE